VGERVVILVVMGVTGCGKTVVGQALAAALGWPFLDGDDFHPPANVEKMRAGIPLTDDDRWPWLDRLVDELRAACGREGHAILGCSALRQVYRDRLKRAGDVRFVHLAGDRATIAARLAARQHRYMPPALLDSQIATLEPPQDALVVDVDTPLDEQVRRVLAAFHLERGR
jgi:gluconokinase